MRKVVKGKSPQVRVRWHGQIESIQCRAWVWRYQMHNRTHHHLGFNLFVKGEANGRERRFIVAVSDTQNTKLKFGVGDVFKGTAWPCINAKHDIADYYRAGGFKALNRVDEQTDPTGPPFTGLLPSTEVFERRGARMLDLKLWRKQCFTCMWANKSAVEIEYKFGKVKRYRKETFCYGPRSCPIYHMGPPRQVPYFDTFPSIDEGWMDDLCTEQRGEED
jgi:hypothetical protein